MDLSRLRSVYEHEGWFATAYLESRSPGADAGEQIRLRWQALRRQLESDGAPAAALDPIEAALDTDDPGEPQIDGRVLVATEEAGVVLDEPWDAALGAGDKAHWTVIPELGAFAREAARAVRELVVVCDAQGAQIRREVVAEQHEPVEQSETTVEGSAHEGVHKPRGGALAHNRIQRRADETVQRNAKDIVEHMRRAADHFRPRVIMLAGEVQARTAVREHLSEDIANRVVETDRGGRDEHASEDSLNEELLELAGRESAERAKGFLDQLNSGLSHSTAVQGGELVAQAAETGAVETLLYEDGKTASREAFLLKLCAEIDSAFAVVPAETGLEDGVAAVLRFPLPQHQTQA